MKLELFQAKLLVDFSNDFCKNLKNFKENIATNELIKINRKWWDNKEIKPSYENLQNIFNFNYFEAPFIKKIYNPNKSIPENIRKVKINESNFEIFINKCSKSFFDKFKEVNKIVATFHSQFGKCYNYNIEDSNECTHVCERSYIMFIAPRKIIENLIIKSKENNEIILIIQYVKKNVNDDKSKLYQYISPLGYIDSNFYGDKNELFLSLGSDHVFNNETKELINYDNSANLPLFYSDKSATKIVGKDILSDLSDEGIITDGKDINDVNEYYENNENNELLFFNCYIIYKDFCDINGFNKLMNFIISCR